ncbi:TAXI family TRAP transporter solute-binding subunit [Chloroflexota bacterium]
MRVKRCIFIAMAILLVVGLILPLACAKPTPTPAPAPKPKLPEVVILTCLPAGAGQGARMVGIVEGANQFSPDMKIRIEPREGDVAIFGPVLLGDAEFCNATGPTTWDASNARWPELGKAVLHRVWNGSPFVVGFATKADSGIETMADAKGRRIPSTPASKSWSDNNLAFLAYEGVTKDDVEIVTVPSIGAGYAGLGEGTIDACAATPFSTTAVEIAASRHGLRWLSIPPDKEAWERVNAVRPSVVPIKVRKAAGLKEGEHFYGLGYTEGIWASPDLSDDVVYAFCDALKKGYPVYKDMEKSLPAWDWERAHSPDVLDLPYHNGFIKFLKDNGVWTPEHDAVQQRALKLEKERQAK